MKLFEFEEQIDDVILQRGRDYFNNGNVEEIKEIDNNRYIVEVAGSEIYTVSIKLNENEVILETDCDCPYDWGEFCKHQAAAFFALKDEKEGNSKKSRKKKTTKPEKKVNLKTIVSSLSKDDLINIILESSYEYPEIEKKLLFKYAPAKDEISVSKKLIREYINRSKRHGFIEWRYVSDAVQGAEITLEKAQAKIEDGETESAVLLCIAVLSIVVDMLQYCDDSSGIVGDIINTSLEMIDEAVSEGIDQLNQQQEKTLFTAILKEAQNSRYEGWTDWSISLLKACVYFAGNADLRLTLETLFNRMIEKAGNDAWNSKYIKENVKLLQLELLEQFDGDEKVKQFINENVYYSPIREIAINRLLKKEDYHEVIRLCKEGEEVDKEYRGLVSRWKKYRFQAYEMMGAISEQKALALEFLYVSHFEYYAKLKKLYQPNEWDEVLKEIILYFKLQSHRPSVFLQILIEENLTEEILEYCKKNISSVQTLFPYLVKDYFDEVNDLFITYIEASAAQASDRKKYKNVCSLIKTYKKAFGDHHAHEMIQSLREKYIRRPAFVDELGKIK
ncbi:SWIM zinc finger domain-containing protein [Bacillus sp. 03113]|uniref:SWIM zinc finger family protein n=1 Tax=Bacillus sp. 03113 TaxID=2578211 RepID=UPI0011433547|nr:SWIM zinc finger family protein [Bacillus sp. 03113]